MTILAIAALGFALQDAKPMPLIHATALTSAGALLYAGTSTGEVHAYDIRTREPMALLTADRKGVVSQVAASSSGVAWILSSRPTSIRDRFASEEDVSAQALVFRTPDHRTYTVDLKPAGVDRPVRALSWLGSRLWILTDFGAAFYNTKSNAVEVASTFLPKSIADDVERSRVWVRDPYLMTVKPVTLRRNPKSSGLPFVSLFTVYKLDGTRWSNLGGFASNALDIEPEGELNVGEDGKIPANARFSILSETVDLDEGGVSAIEGRSLLHAPLFKANWESQRQPLPGWFGESTSPDALWVQVVGDDMWSWNGVALLKQSRTKLDARAFVPWNDPQMLPNDFLPDASGAWIATNVGVRRIEFSAPDAAMGYGGFLSIPLGSQTERAPNKNIDKVVRELYRWRFAPENLAGKDGAKMISEIYKTVGVSLPPSSQGILNSPAAIPVRDEIKLGDVIFSTKSLAVYLGNGKTAELKDGVVKNGTVWDRPFAIVRRFVK